MFKHRAQGCELGRRWWQHPRARQRESGLSGLLGAEVKMEPKARLCPFTSKYSHWGQGLGLCTPAPTTAACRERSLGQHRRKGMRWETGCLKNSTALCICQAICKSQQENQSMPSRSVLVRHRQSLEHLLSLAELMKAKAQGYQRLVSQILRWCKLA